MLDHMLGSQGSLTLGQECARAVVIFVYGVLAVRLAGRRIFARWSAIDIVVSIVAGSNLSRALTGPAPLWGTLAATTLLFVLHWLVAHAVVRWPRVSALVEGTPIEIGRAGRIDARRARSGKLSTADLDEALRQAGVEDAGATSRVILEPSGRISVLKERR